MASLDQFDIVASQFTTRRAIPVSEKMSDARLTEACEQFEALFVSQLFKEMRASVPDDGIIAPSRGEKIFQQMLDNEYATQISKSQSLGLAAMLYRQLSSDRAPAKASGCAKAIRSYSA